MLFGDCNDRPGGPVRAVLSEAGFVNIPGDIPTALIGEERAPLDLIAVRGVYGMHIPTLYTVDGIPHVACPSDHIPVVVDVEIGQFELKEDTEA